MTLLLISFIAGVLTILAPCILPLLPVIVGGSLDGGETSKKRAQLERIRIRTSTRRTHT